MPLPLRTINYDLSQFTGDEFAVGETFLRITPTVTTVCEGIIVPAITVTFNPDAAGQGTFEAVPGDLGTPEFDYRAELYRRVDGGVSPYQVLELPRFRVPVSAGPFVLADLMAAGVPPAETTYWQAITQAEYEQFEGWRDEAQTAAAQAALYDGPWLDTVAALLADTTLIYTAGTPSSVAAGDYVQTRAEGFRYQVAASGATNQHVTTAGGVKLYVIAGARGFDVRAFGALVNVAGQDAAIDMCLTTAANARAMAYFPSGQWRKSTTLTINVPQGDGGFGIIGDGDGNSNIRLDTGGNGLVINLPGSWWLYSAGGSTAFRCQDIVFSTNNANAGVGVQLNGSSASGRPGPTIRFTRCMWRANNFFEQFWSRALEVIDCQNTYYDMCRWECGGPSNTTANGVWIGGTAQAASPTLHYFTSCTWDYGNVALELGNFVEGAYLIQPTIVGSNIGVRFHPSQGESGLVIDGGHMSTKQRWVSLENVFDFEIYGGLYYRSGGDATFRGIRLATSGMGVISGNVFRGGNSADGADIAIDANSLINEESRGVLVSCNTFHNWQTRAIWAGANANYFTVASSNLFRNCLTRVLNQSSNNSVYVEPKTLTGTVNRVFTGGAATEVVDFALPLGLFRIAPTGEVSADAASRSAINGFYDLTGSTATSARFVFVNPAGGNIAAGTYRFHFRVSENVISNSI